jgi:hypothetical protein
VDFDSTMRRFESSRPSQHLTNEIRRFWNLANFHSKHHQLRNSVSDAFASTWAYFGKAAYANGRRFCTRSGHKCPQEFGFDPRTHWQGSAQGARITFAGASGPMADCSKQPVEIYLEVGDVEAYCRQLQKMAVKITEPSWCSGGATAPSR